MKAQIVWTWQARVRALNQWDGSFLQVLNLQALYLFNVKGHNQVNPYWPKHPNIGILILNGWMLLIVKYSLVNNLFATIKIVYHLHKAWPLIFMHDYPLYFIKNVYILQSFMTSWSLDSIQFAYKFPPTYSMCNYNPSYQVLFFKIKREVICDMMIFSSFCFYIHYRRTYNICILHSKMQVSNQDK